MTIETTESSSSTTLLDSFVEETSDSSKSRAAADERSIFNLFSRGLDVAVKVLLIATFVVGYFEYNAALRERELKASFELITNWEDGGFQGAYEAISHKVEAFRQSFRDETPASARNAALERAFVSNKILQLVASDQSFDAQVGQVFYFFGKLGVCVQQDICNSEMVHGFFHTSAEDFFYYFQSYAQQVRAQGQPDFARFAEQFVKSGF